MIAHNTVTKLRIESLVRSDTIEHNVVNGSVSLLASSGLDVRGNTITGGGLSLAGVDSSVVRRNAIRQAPANGISVGDSGTLAGVADRNVLIHNTVVLSVGHGIVIQGHSLAIPGATNTVLLGNRTRLNGRDGIHTDAASTTLLGNIADRNLQIGINAPAGVVDGGNNRASGNGFAQCVGLTCAP